MNTVFRKPWTIFLISASFFAAIFCLFPINLFSGVIIYTKGLQEVAIEAPLSLSYFLGIGYEEKDMVGVVDFYLKPSGYLTAFIFIIGIPGLVAYRIYLSNSKKSNEN